MRRQVQLTQEGFTRLRGNLEQEYRRLEEATAILQELTGSSDDYDDSGLEEAKNEKSRIEERIDKLEDELNRSIIIEEHKMESVELGAVVTLQDTSSKEAFSIQLVSPIEAGVLEGDIPKVSDESPLGIAIMGRKEGDQFKVKISEKATEYTLMSIE
jgi:transcription elongation factor GreA